MLGCYMAACSILEQPQVEKAPEFAEISLKRYAWKIWEKQALQS
jgi:hypothetical protein